MRCARASTRSARRKNGPNGSRRRRRNAPGPSVVLVAEHMRWLTSALNRRGVLAAVTFVLLAAAPRQAFAQTDEIQVYDGGLAGKGQFNLTWHNNFTPNGVKTPAFPGAVVSDKS